MVLFSRLFFKGLYRSWSSFAVFDRPFPTVSPQRLYQTLTLVCFVATLAVFFIGGVASLVTAHNVGQGIAFAGWCGVIGLLLR